MYVTRPKWVLGLKCAHIRNCGTHYITVYDDINVGQRKNIKIIKNSAKLDSKDLVVINRNDENILLWYIY